MNIIKKLLRLIIFWCGPVVVLAVGLWLYLNGGRYAGTENAYLKSEMVSISSELPGRVKTVLVADNGRVAAGDLLFSLDDDAYRIALARAEANLLKVRSNIESLRADYLNQQAGVNKALTDHDYYQREFVRLQRLAASESVSAVQVDQAEYQVEHAQRELEIQRQTLEVVKARLVNPALPVEQHPDYLLALAERDKASLDLSHIEVRAPVGGVVAHFNVKAGEVVASGVPLFSLVNDTKLWVEANYKETDLTWMRVGQEAVITVDAYPGYEWRGRVTSITPGTGSEFSLLPAQNSSGNWVKVVQRIAVKLAMDPIADAPALTAGMSAQVEVDTGHERHLADFWQ